MKALILLLLASAIVTTAAHTQSMENARRTTVKQPSSVQSPIYKTPPYLVSVFPKTESPDDISRYTGTLNTQTSMILTFSEFYTNTMWAAARDMRGSIKVTGAAYSSSSIDKICIYKPKGPVTSPSTENFADGIFAAICTGNGQIFYAEIDGSFSAADNTLRFLDKDRNGTSQIILGWDTRSQQWAIKAGTTYKGPGEGTVVVLYYYPDITTEFYKRPAGSKGYSLDTGQQTASSSRNEDFSLSVEKNPSLSRIVFADNRKFFAHFIDQQSAEIKIRLKPSGDLYTINKKRIILSGHGKYSVGSGI